MRGGELISKLSDKEYGYLIGMFLGDGYLHHDKKNRHYTIEFYLNSISDKDIQIFLMKILEKINCKPSVRKDKRYNCNRIRIRSMSLFSCLSNLKFMKNNNFNLGLVSGIIDSDGYVNHKKSYIQIINTDKHLMDKIKIILNNMEFNIEIKERSKSKKDKKKSYIIYVPFRFISTDNISVKVNRFSGVEQSVFRKKGAL